jgi:hypothetical protein
MVEERKYGDLVADDAAIALNSSDGSTDPIEALPSHDEIPSSWFFLIVSGLWSVFAFAFGFETVVNLDGWLIDGKSWVGVVALLDLAGFLFTASMAFMLWKRREWLPKRIAETSAAAATNTYVWIGVFVLVLIISALQILPRGFGAATKQTSDADIIKATAPIRAELDAEKQRSAKLQSQADTALRERDAARQAASAPLTVNHQAPLSHEEKLQLTTKIDVLKSAPQYFGAFINVYNSWSTLQISWSETLKGNRPQFNSEILSIKTNLRNASKQMEDLRSEYPQFHDIYDIFSQPNTGATLKAIDDLVTAVTSLPDPLPPDYDIRVRPYVGTLSAEIDALLQWIVKSQKSVQNSLKELSALSRQ